MLKFHSPDRRHVPRRDDHLLTHPLPNRAPRRLFERRCLTPIAATSRASACLPLWRQSTVRGYVWPELGQWLLQADRPSRVPLAERDLRCVGRPWVLTCEQRDSGMIVKFANIWDSPQNIPLLCYGIIPTTITAAQFDARSLWRRSHRPLEHIERG